MRIYSLSFFLLVFATSACLHKTGLQDGLTSDQFIEYKPEQWEPKNHQANAMLHFLIAEQKSLSGKFTDASDLYEASYQAEPNSVLGAKIIESNIQKGLTNQSFVQAKKMVLL